MAQLNLVILPAKALKDGRHKIRISVSHNGTTRYIPTSVVIDSASEFSKGSVRKRPDAAYLNTKLRKLLQRQQEILDSLEVVECLSCAELVELMKMGTIQSHRTLSSIIDEFMKLSQMKESSKCAMAIGIKAILLHVNGNMLMEHINCSIILSLDATLRKEKKKDSTIRNYMAFFKMIINYAIKCGYVSYKVHPFAVYKLPQMPIRDSWLTKEQIKLIRDLEIPKKRVKLAMVRDVFMLSYYLGGINYADLCRINFNKQEKMLHYIRKKIEGRTAYPIPVEFVIPDEALEIINRLKNENGLIELIHTTDLHRANSFICFHMNTLRKLTGIPNLLYYSARKSFSQHAIQLGIPDSTVDYILGHSQAGSRSSLYPYRYITPEMATNAIRTVLDNLK